jgi:hypothetical protein
VIPIEIGVLILQDGVQSSRETLFFSSFDQTDSARKPPLFYENDNSIFDGLYGSSSRKNDEGEK